MMSNPVKKNALKRRQMDEIGNGLSALHALCMVFNERLNHIEKALGVRYEWPKKDGEPGHYVALETETPDKEDP